METSLDKVLDTAVQRLDGEATMEDSMNLAMRHYALSVPNELAELVEKWASDHGLFGEELMERWVLERLRSELSGRRGKRS